MSGKREQGRGFYRTFFSICLALVLQNIVTLSVNLADNVMLGAYSEQSLSGVSAVNQIQFVYQMVLVALGDGLVMFCSQYWGMRRIEPMKKIAAAAMDAALLIAAALFVAASCFPEQLLRLFTTDSAIIAEGVRYLKIIRFTYLFFAVTQILLATLRSVEIVRIAFFLSVQTFLINCGINYVLIYGRFGAPELGAAGAAIGTLAARVVECAVLIGYIAKKERTLNLRVRDYTRLDRALCRDYLRETAPMIAVQTLWGLNVALQTVILGHLTSAAIAANSASSTLYSLVKAVPLGAASAACVVIGRTVGSGELSLVKTYARGLQKIFLLIGIAGGIVLFFLRIPVLSLYRLSSEAKELANTFLIILSVVFVGMAYQVPTNTGIIRGGGDALFGVKMDLISIWGIVIPLSLVMAFVVKASPQIVVCCLNADQIFKCVPAFLKVNYGNWIRKLTRD